MTTYILERGSYQAASLGYSYARRAQSVTQTAAVAPSRHH